MRWRPGSGPPFKRGFYGQLVQNYQDESVLTYVYVRCGTFAFNSYYLTLITPFCGAKILLLVSLSEVFEVSYNALLWVKILLLVLLSEVFEVFSLLIILIPLGSRWYFILLRSIHSSGLYCKESGIHV